MHRQHPTPWGFMEYLDAGDPAGEAVLFLHGLGMQALQFEAQVESFAPEYRVLVPSFKGHGRSERLRRSSESGPDWQPSASAKDVWSLLDTLSISRTHVVGSSMGGVVALEMLRQREEALCSLTLFGTAPELKLPAWAVAGVVWSDRVLLRLLGPARYAQMMSRATSREPDTRARAEASFFAVAQEDPQALLGYRRAIGHYCYLEALESTSVPSMILRAGRDREINRQLQRVEEMMRSWEHLRWVELSEAGHLANLDCPGAFNEALQTFWQSLNSAE